MPRAQVTTAARCHLIVDSPDTLPLDVLRLPEAKLPTRIDEAVFSDYYIIGPQEEAFPVPKAAIYRHSPREARQSTAPLDPSSVQEDACRTQHDRAAAIL